MNSTAPSTRHAGEIPSDLRCLLARGFDRTMLQNIHAEAMRTGVAANETLLASGAVPAGDYLAAIADSLALPFVDARDETLGSLVLHPGRIGVSTCLRVATTRDGRILIAPVGRALSLLVEYPLTLARVHGRVSLTSPQHLRDAVFAQAGQAVLDEALSGLMRDRPDLSARTAGPATVWTFAVLLGGGGIAVVASLAAAVTAHIVMVASALLSAAVFGVVGLVRARLVVTATPDALPPPLCDHSLPHVSVLLPMYAEAAMIPHLANAMAAFDYPAAKLEIIALLETGDHATRAAIAAEPLARTWLVVTVPPGQPRTKPRALQVGLLMARGDLVAVYDAEDIPHPAQLRVAAAALHAGGPTLACVQAALSIPGRDTWLERQFALEYDMQFRAILPALAARGWPMPLGGTSNVFRADVVRKLGGWDPWNVTEDADIGVRLARFGYRCATVAVPTIEEAPNNARVWFNQRRRWMKGYLQTLIVHARRPDRLLADLGWRRSTGLAAVLGGTVLSALVYPFSLPLVAWSVSHLAERTPADLMLLAVSLAIFVSGYVLAFITAVKARGLDAADAWTLATLPAYWLLVSVAAWWAVHDVLVAPHHWLKTPHRGSAAADQSRARSVAAALSGSVTSRRDTNWPWASSRYTPAE